MHYNVSFKLNKFDSTCICIKKINLKITKFKLKNVVPINCWLNKNSMVKREERLKSVETYEVILSVHKQDVAEWYKYWYTAFDLNNSKSMPSYTGTTQTHTYKQQY